jgi:hypothetical protein
MNTRPLSLRESRPMGRSAPLMSPSAVLAAGASSMTSLRKAPHRPAPAALRMFGLDLSHRQPLACAHFSVSSPAPGAVEQPA